MKILVRQLAIPVLTGMLIIVSGFRAADDSDVKQVYSKVVIKRNDKAEVIAVGAEGQEATIFIKTRELVDEDELNKGTELWIRIKSEYQGKKASSKEHRLMFGTDAYQEHIVVRHMNKKMKQVELFQFNIDIRIIDSESEIDLNV